MTRIVVVGGGVVGFSTAVSVQDILPGADVTVMADAFKEGTTSHGPPGIFRPLLVKSPGVPLHVLMRRLQISWDQYSQLARSGEGGAAGCTFVSGYHLHDGSLKPSLVKYLTTNFRDLTDKELAQFPVQYSHGWFYTTLLVDPRFYVPYLTEKFKSRGGRLIQRHLNSLSEVYGEYDVVVNCAGLGNRQLTGDNKLVPIRGTLLRVKAPWVKHFLYTMTDCYIIPGRENIILGGIPQVGREDTQPLAEDRDDIWCKATTILPSLKGADTSDIEQWVGLRPFRDPLRLETQMMSVGNKKIPVVHNYGHGASGITLGWGTGQEAAQLVVAAIASLHMSKL